MGEEKENISIDDKNTSMRKLDMPIGRLKFFTNSIIIFALQVIAIAIYYIFYFLLKSPNALLTLVVIFSIVFGIPILYLHFINYAKRIWDIAGNFNLAIWLTIVLFAISFICLFFFPIAIIIFYFGMIFISGKYSTK
ncbi:MAG: hypothetical protein V8S20_05930 [Candidatus Gastranaerophilaceae bacterium]